VRAGRTWWRDGWGIGYFAEAWARACEEKGQTFPARGSGRSAGQGPLRQRSLIKKALFVTFWRSKK